MRPTTRTLVVARLVASCAPQGDESERTSPVSIAPVDVDRPDHGFVAAFESTDDQTGLASFVERLLCPSGAAARGSTPVNER